MSRRITRWLAPAASAPVRVVPRLTVLESRLNPATTMYFDFGIGIGVGNTLSTDATAFRNIFGMGIDTDGTTADGTGSDLTVELGATGSLEFSPLSYDYDGNGTTNTADLEALADDVIAIAERAVGPYDIDIRLASVSTAFSQAAVTVANNSADGTGQFDAYNFIGVFNSDGLGGGSVGDNLTADDGHGDGCGCGSCGGVRRRTAADGLGLFGIAAADDLFAQAGNDQDEATLTFADTIFSSTTGTQGTAEFNRNLAHRLAYTVVHEAAHTLTLIHTDGADVSADERLLTSGDQIRVGSVTRETTNIFTRFSLALQGGAGTKNNYDFLRDDTDIGLKDSDRDGIPDFAYVTGTGGHDIITITRATGKSATTQAAVSVRAYSNTARTTLIRSLNYNIDLSKATEGGIVIDGSAGDDEIVINGDVKANFTVRGGDGNDRFVLRGQNNRTLTGYTALGEAGTDTFVVDQTSGAVLPDITASFDGGDPTGASGDSLTLTGATFVAVTHAMSGTDNGEFTFNTGNGLLYAGLEAVDMSGLTVADLYLNLPGGGSAIALEDDGTTGNTFSRLRSTDATPTFASTRFRNPSGTLTVTRGATTDALAVAALPDFTAGLSLGTSSEPFGSVAFNGAVTLATGRSVSAFASSISLPNTASDLILSGTGAVEFGTQRNISIASGASVTTASGNILMNANRQTVTSTGAFVGIDVQGSVTAGSGTVTLAGRGGTSGNDQYGVSVSAGGVVTTTGGGTVSVTGTGGSGSGDRAYGVNVNGTGSLIGTGSSGGAVTVVGTGGTATGGINIGVLVESGGKIAAGGTASALAVTGTGGNGGFSYGVVTGADGLITGGNTVSVTGTGGATGTGSVTNNVGVLVSGAISATGTGLLTVTGTGGASAGDQNYGVRVFGAGAAISGGKAVTVTGTGGGTGTSADNYGVWVQSGGVISSGGNGNLTLTGTGGAGTGVNNIGVLVGVTGAAITGGSGGGTVDITAAGGGGTFGTGFLMHNGGAASAGGGGALSVTADSMELAGSLTTTGTATLRPRSAGTAVNLGGGDVLSGALALGLTSTELATVSAGSLTLGRADSGLVSLATDLSLSPSSVSLVSGGGVTSSEVSGRFATGGGALSVAAGGNFAPFRTGTDLTASAVSFATGSVLDLAIDGTAVDTGYSQLKTSGPVSLTNLSLVLGGSYTPVDGDIFTVVSGSNISGTFVGLGHGAGVTLNGVSMRVFYGPTEVHLVVNRAPVGLTAGGPYNVDEGNGLTVTAAAATDPDGDAVTYTWDVNGDGTFGDESGGTVSDGGRTVAFTGAQLAALGLGDGPTSVTAAVRASDGAASSTATAALTVFNLPPTITALTVPGTATAGTAVALSVAATDPAGALDPLTFTWFVNGTPVSTGSAANFSFTPPLAGTYAVSVTATDGDGGTATGSAVVTVNPSTVVPTFATFPVVVTAVDGLVSVTDSTTGTTRTLTPYPGFGGGVTVASSDLNGDGYPEIVTGAGPGGGPHVKVYDGKTLDEVASFFAYNPLFNGGVNVAAGGGRIATGSAAVATHVRVFNGRTFAEEQSFFAFTPLFAGGVRVALGDLDGDGVPEVAASTGPGTFVQVSVFAGTNSSQITSFFPFTLGFTGGAFVAIGGGQIAVSADAGAAPHVRTFDAFGNEKTSFFAYDPVFRGGVRVAFADTDADGVVELITAPGAGGGPHIKAWSLAPLGLKSQRFAGDPSTATLTGVFVA